MILRPFWDTLYPRGEERFNSVAILDLLACHCTSPVRLAGIAVAEPPKAEYVAAESAWSLQVDVVTRLGYDDEVGVGYQVRHFLVD